MPSVSPQSVFLVKPRGFCAGAARAIDIVELALETYGPPIYVHKEIVHNAHVVRDLAQSGAVFVDEVDEVPRGARLIYSARGVSPAVRRGAEARALKVIDATFPLVTTVHLETIQFAKDHCTILMIGRRNHDEVAGTLGEAPDRTIVVSTPEEAETVEVPGTRVAYLMQATLSLDEADAIVSVLKRRFPHIQGPPAQDIRYATQNRQQAVKNIAPQADPLLVVGSGNSSNSQRLVEAGQREGPPSHLVDSETDVRPEWLARPRRVGVSAGASTPESLVRRVVQHLRTLGFDDIQESQDIEENVFFPLPTELRAARPPSQIAAHP